MRYGRYRYIKSTLETGGTACYTWGCLTINSLIVFSRFLSKDIYYISNPRAELCTLRQTTL